MFRLADMKMCTVAFENISYEELGSKEMEFNQKVKDQRADGEPDTPRDSAVSSSYPDEGAQTQIAGKTQRGDTKHLYFSGDVDDHFC